MASKKHRGALVEVRRKSSATIERETAGKWRDRALACLAEHKRTGKVTWLRRANEYAHEALEHAALVRDGGKLVGKIQRDLRGVV